MTSFKRSTVQDMWLCAYTGEQKKVSGTDPRFEGLKVKKQRWPSHDIGLDIGILGLPWRKQHPAQSPPSLRCLANPRPAHRQHLNKKISFNGKILIVFEVLGSPLPIFPLCSTWFQVKSAFCGNLAAAATWEVEGEVELEIRQARYSPPGFAREQGFQRRGRANDVKSLNRDLLQKLWCIFPCWCTVRHNAADEHSERVCSEAGDTLGKTSATKIKIQMDIACFFLEGGLTALVKMDIFLFWRGVRACQCDLEYLYTYKNYD